MVGKHRVLEHKSLGKKLQANTDLIFHLTGSNCQHIFGLSEIHNTNDFAILNAISVFNERFSTTNIVPNLKKI